MTERLSRAKIKQHLLEEEDDICKLSFQEDFWKRIRDQNLDSCLAMNDDGSIQIKESMLHVEDLAYCSTLENFLIRLFSVLYKFEFEVRFLEVGLILNDHRFNEFDVDDWNAKWNNCEVTQFIPYMIERMSGAVGDKARFSCIQFNESESRLYNETKDSFSRYGYDVLIPKCDDELLEIHFPVNRIRNFCFRVTARK
jgi:hypothetical protein